MKICTTSVPRKKMYKSSANSTRVKIDPIYTKSYLQSQTVWFWTRNLGRNEVSTIVKNRWYTRRECTARVVPKCDNSSNCWCIYACIYLAHLYSAFKGLFALSFNWSVFFLVICLDFAGSIGILIGIRSFVPYFSWSFGSGGSDAICCLHGLCLVLWWSERRRMLWNLIIRVFVSTRNLLWVSGFVAAICKRGRQYMWGSKSYLSVWK
jgi:hypothetical protein